MEPLNLNRELVQNLLRVLQQHDERCEDSMIAAQYLAAVMGLLVGNTAIDTEGKREAMGELSAFAEHVLGDVLERSQRSAAPPAVDPSKAFGIWKPPAN